MEQERGKFESEFAAVLEGLGNPGKGCPATDRLIAWRQGELDAGLASGVAAHVSNCSACAELVSLMDSAPADVDELTWKRARRNLDRRLRPWQQRRWRDPMQWGLVAVGLAVVAVIGVMMQTPESEMVPEVMPTATRSAAAIMVTAPAVDTTQAVFRWQASPVHHAYVVELDLGDAGLKSVEVKRPPLRADAELLDMLEPGSTYQWRVLAVDPSGGRLAESGWTEFRLER